MQTLAFSAGALEFEIAEDKLTRRLMFLTPFPPRLDAADGGARAMAQLLSRLARRHSVGVLSLCRKGDLPVDASLYRDCAWVEEIHYPEPPTSSNFVTTVQVWSNVLRGRPLWVSDCYAPAFAERVHAHVQRWSPQIVQAEFHVMAQYLTGLDPYVGATVLVEHEPGFSTAQERYKFQRNRGRLLPHLDALAWKRYERASLKAADAVVVFTERDRRALGSLYNTNSLTTIPLGADFPNQALDPLGTLPLNLLFVGNFNHPPNVDAAFHLALCIFPRLRARYPELVLYLVGANPPDALKEQCDDGVVVTGHVADVTPYMDRAAIIVAPLRYGGGMRVKVIEALAAGKAIVASHRAVEGLDLTDEKQFRLANDDDEMVAAIADLLVATDKRLNLARSARAWAVAHLDWGDSIRAYEALYEQILDREGSRQYSA